MTEYEEDQIEFSVLSLVRDPLRDHIEELARNVKELQNIRGRLSDTQLADVRGVLGNEVYEQIILGASPALGLTEEDVNRVEAVDKERSVDELPEEYVRLANSQRDIERSIKDEMQIRQSDQTFAEGKRHDYSAAMEFWARALARKGVVKEFLA
jgi:ubiquitin carboxyl-terminal hydrolase L5